MNDYLESVDDPLEFLSSIMAAIPAFVTRIDLDWKVRYINLIDRGMDPSMVIDRNVFDFIEPQYHSLALEVFQRVADTGEKSVYSSRATTPEGQTSDYDNHVAPIRREGRVVGLCIVGVDVSEGIRNRRAIEVMERRYGLAVEATGLGMWGWDLRTDEGYWSPQMSVITGLTGPVPGDDFFEIMHPDDRARAAGNQQAMLSEGSFQDTTRIIVDGEIRWIHTIGKAAFDADGAPIHIAGGMLDVTEHQRTVARLRRAEKLEAVGQMTAGVAHNFNNMLMALLPSLELLEGHVDAAGRPHLEAARQVSARAADIIRQLSTFASPDAQTAANAIPLVGAVHDAVHMVTPTFDRMIEVRVDAPGEVFVASTEADLSQVLVNVLLNAHDALVGARTEAPQITIEVSTLDDPTMPSGSSRVGRFGRVVISDNGPGMSDAVLERVFEPFFTTKGDGGSGLGLAASYAIVRRLGGWLAVTSQQGEWTRFEFAIPATEPPSAVDSPAGAGAEAANDLVPSEDRGPSPRVLVVDDEPLVRRVTERALTRRGFGVVATDSVRSAREVLSADADFALVIIDRSMPDAPGRDLVPDVREHAPDAKIAFLTGDTAIGDERRLVDGVLSKPMTARELVSAVTALLEAD